MKILRIVILLSLAALVLFGKWFLTPVPKAAGTPPTITFTGFTNEQGAIKAQFVVSNATTRAIFYAPFAPQFRSTDEEWHFVKLPKGGIRPLTPLAPGAVINVSVYETNIGTWRLPLWWEFVPGTRDYAQEAWRQNWRAIGEKRRPPGWHVGVGLLGWTNYSSTITNVHTLQLR